MDEFLDNSLVLGTGGSQAGICVLPPGQRDATRVCALPAGHSVYALDVDAEHRRVAAGTRAGTLHVLTWPAGGGAAEPQHVQLHHGAPVLAVCLWNAARLISTDTAGRVLVWDLAAEPTQPPQCLSDGPVIAALLALPGDQLVGLAADGHLLFWEQGRDGPPRRVPGPRPPAKLALVQLRYWPQQHAVVYGGADGCVAAFRLEPSELLVWQAHAGACYALLVDGDELYTFGHRDARAKVWAAPGEPPRRVARVAPGILAAAGCGERSGTALLLGANFEAGVYDLGTDPLQRLRGLSGRTYRSVAGMSAGRSQVARAPTPQALMDELRTRIRAQLHSNDLADLDALHAQLVALGGESDSLALRAEQAGLERDYTTELELRGRLAARGPARDPDAWTGQLRYAELLVAGWRLAEARAVYADLPAEQVPATTDLAWLDRAATLMQGAEWIAAPSSLPLVCDAADVRGAAIVGRWAAADLGHYLLNGPQLALTAELLAAKYEQLRQEQQRADLPPARPGRFWWLAPQTATAVDLVVFEAPDSPAQPALRLAAQVQPQGAESLIVLRGLLNAGPPAPAQPWADHNCQVRALLTQNEQTEAATNWCRPTQELLAHALRRLHNLASAQRPDRRDL
jgi:hypothetical protein